MICRYSTFICVIFFKYIFCYITFYIVMYTLLCVFCMFSLVYEGPTADELRSEGFIYIYIKCLFYEICMYACIFLSVPSVNKVFIIIIIIITNLNLM